MHTCAHTHMTSTAQCCSVQAIILVMWELYKSDNGAAYLIWVEQDANNTVHKWLPTPRIQRDVRYQFRPIIIFTVNWVWAPHLNCMIPTYWNKYIRIGRREEWRYVVKNVKYTTVCFYEHPAQPPMMSPCFEDMFTVFTGNKLKYLSKCLLCCHKSLYRWRIQVSGALPCVRARNFTPRHVSLSSGVAFQPELWRFKGTEVSEPDFCKTPPKWFTWCPTH